MSTIVFTAILAFVFGFLFGAVYGTKKCINILLDSPKVREILGEEQWQAFMSRAGRRIEVKPLSGNLN